MIYSWYLLLKQTKKSTAFWINPEFCQCRGPISRIAGQLFRSFAGVDIRSDPTCCIDLVESTVIPFPLPSSKTPRPALTSANTGVSLSWVRDSSPGASPTFPWGTQGWARAAPRRRGRFPGCHGGHSGGLGKASRPREQQLRPARGCPMLWKFLQGHTTPSKQEALPSGECRAWLTGSRKSLGRGFTSLPVVPPPPGSVKANEWVNSAVNHGMGRGAGKHCPYSETGRARQQHVACAI